MITTAFDLEQDQQRCDEQAAIAEELAIMGEGDALEYNDPARTDWAYMAGYARGLRLKMAYIREQAQMLEAEGLAVETEAERIFDETLIF